MDKEQSMSKYTPRDYQLDINKAAIEYFASNSRGKLILPCGAGKTLSSMWIAQSLKSRSILVCVPSLALLRQFKDVWLNSIKTEFDYLCVCSEKDIDKDHDDLNININEIDKKPTRVTNNLERICDFIKLNSNSDFIIYSTYQSLDLVSIALQSQKFEFSLVIADEAHRVVNIAGSGSFTLIHDNNLIPAKHRLYMTATPKVFSKSRIAQQTEDEIYDMNNEQIFGNVFYQMSFAEAIERKILVNYKLIIVGVTDKDIQKQIFKNKLVAQDIDAQELANNYALNKVMIDYGANHAVTFHNTIKDSTKFVERHKVFFPEVHTNYVIGKEKTIVRKQKLVSFENHKLAVLSNARCLGEGVDLPDIDLVQFCCPKQSVIDITQSIGRALRQPNNPNSKKTVGYIVIPIFYSNTDNLENILARSQYAEIINVVRAISLQDETLAGLFINSLASVENNEVLIEEYKKYSEMIILDNFDIKLKQALFTKIIFQSVQSWDQKYDELKRYLNEHHKFPNHKTTLGNWCQNQKYLRKTNRLNPEREEKLKELGFKWVSDLHIDELNEFKWSAQFEQLKEFIQINNRYPKKPNRNTRHIKTTETEVAKWLGIQRVQYKQGHLSEERINKLNSINFIWSEVEMIWEKKLKELIEYIKTHNVHPTKDNGKNSIYKWCSWQKLMYRAGKLPQEKIDKLTSLGMNFDKSRDFISSDESFEINYKIALDLVKYHGVIPTKRNGDFKFNKIGTWVVNQRKKFKEGKLTPEQILKMEQIPNFVWNPVEELWLSKYNEYKNNRNNNTQFSVSLSCWVSTQRKYYREKNYRILTQNKIDLLNQINFVWENEDKWLNNYNEYSTFINSNDPTKKLSLALAQWEAKIRREFKSNTIKESKKELLDKINFNYSNVYKDSKELLWQHYYNEVITFINQNNGKRPNGKTKLGSWLSNQLQRYKHEKLLPERRKLIENLLEKL